MTDEVTTPQPEAEQGDTPAVAEEQQADQASADLEKWKALAKKHEQRAKDNAAAAIRLAEIEEANKTEAQKLADRATAAEARAIEAERKAFAAEKGVPVSLLSGDTPEAWEAAAAEALAWRGDQKLPPAPPATGQGNVGDPIGDGPGQVTSRDQLKRMSPEEIVKAKAEGRLNDLLGIKP